MKRWHVLVIALIACSWIGTGAFWQIKETQRNRVRDAMQGDNNGRQGGGDFDRTQWRMASASERKAAMELITSQIEAFKRRDFDAALKLQSTELRANFASADAFGSMMKSIYSDFLSPKSISFGRGRVPADAGRLSIRVGLVTKDGSDIRAVYHLMREDNEWRVSGVSGGLRGSGSGSGNRMPNGGGPPSGGPPSRGPLPVPGAPGGRGNVGPGQQTPGRPQPGQVPAQSI